MKKYKNIYIVCVLTWSLLGVKTILAPPRSVSFRGLIQNFDEHPHPFHMQSPPGTVYSVYKINNKFIQYYFYQLFSYQSLHGKQNILVDSKMPYNTAIQMHPQDVQ